MNYNLAKKLKDAGYKFIEMIDRSPHCYYCGHPFVEINDRYYIVPTLSELIGMCGNKLILWKFEENWCAGIFNTSSGSGYTDSYVDDYPNPIEKGLTPEEAVANLWLELNSMKK